MDNSDKQPLQLTSFDSVVDLFRGMEQVGEVVGVGPTAVGNAITRKAFPPSWFDLLDIATRERNARIDRSLFGFRRCASSSPPPVGQAGNPPPPSSA